MVSLRRYTQSDAPEWDKFVEGSKNGTFLFMRGYMDYHQDRFRDHSLMFYNEKGRLIALLPANERDGVLCSHQGLTYGGLVLGKEAVTESIVEAMRVLRDYLREVGIERMIYKPAPWIYDIVPADEPLYALHVVFADYRLTEREPSSTIVLSEQLKWKESRKGGLRKAEAAGIEVAFGEDYPEFWQMLAENLETRHHVKPVHSIDEILLLKGRFPKNIMLAEARKDDKLVGGIVVYVSQQVVHTQYIASNDEGKQCGAVDAIMDYLLKSFPDHRYFDFGKSNEADSADLNAKLLFQKEGYGARTLCYDTYEINI